MSRSSSIKREDLDYRTSPGLNYSSIKTFAQSGYQSFYKEFINGESYDEDDINEKAGVIIGSVLDFLRIDCGGNLEIFNQRYDERFCLFQGIKSNSQDFELADKLYGIYERDKDSSTFSEQFKEAVDIMKRKGKYKNKTEESILESFQAKPSKEKLADNPNLTSAEDYYLAKIDNIGKQTVDIYQLDTAKRLLNITNKDSWLKDVFYSSMEMKNKFVIFWEYNGMECKSELDITLWDHDNKIVYPKDLKCIFSTTLQVVKYRYYKLLYGWQAAFYTLALRSFLDQNNMSDWKVAPFEFLFVGYAPNSRPARVEVSEDMMKDALEGKEGDYLKGILFYLEQIQWHLDNNIWDGTKEQYENNGKLSI